jgi:hypothetical protein
MIQTIAAQRSSFHADHQARRREVVAALWMSCYLGIVLASTWHLLTNSLSLSTAAWLIFFGGAAAIIYRPVTGVYMLAGLTLFGDFTLVPWYPFTKNLSSYESLLFLHNAAIFSPLEIFLALTLLSWLVRVLFRRERAVHTGPLWWPLAAFTGFVTYALFYGLGRGGDTTIALWESRAIFYMPLIYLLTVNLIKTRGQINAVIWWAMLGIILKAVAGFWVVVTVLDFKLGVVERIAEHSTSIQLDAVIVMAAAAWVYRASALKRLVLTTALPLVVLVLFANQRRASFLTLAVALALMAVVLFRERRTAFYLIVPALSLLFIGYSLAFWGSTSPIAMPARAVRSVIDPSGGNTRDQASNTYRIIENFNIMVTIKSAPLTGVGFGQKFFVAISMADISDSFVWWEYITHNSIMYMWMKTGLGGFASLIFLLCYALMVAARTTWRMPPDDMGAIALTATLYLLMHFMFAYVDMSWFGQNMIFVGLSMGLIGLLERVVDARPAPTARRWPWQAEPPPPPGLRLE